MRKPIADLNGREFDVLIIGGGINGAAAAQKVAADGYDVLLVEKGDYGSGSSSRSSRLLHCGLRYLAPGRSMWDFVRHPSRLVTALVMARSCMVARTEFTRDTAVRSRLMKFSFPIYKNGPYRGWQIDIAFFILRLLWRQGPPLNYRRISGAEAAQALGVQDRVHADALGPVELVLVVGCHRLQLIQVAQLPRQRRLGGLGA